MPHIIMEFSQPLQPLIDKALLLKQLHQTVLECGLFTPESVKARSLSYDDTVLPDGATGFMHITCSILTGRTEAQRKALSVALFRCARDTLPEAINLSVNIHEMNAQTYEK